MIWMTFECPETGRALRAMQSAVWSEVSTDALMALHCPKCSKMHMFGRDDAILEMTGAPRQSPGWRRIVSPTSRETTIAT